METSEAYEANRETLDEAFRKHRKIGKNIWQYLK